MIEAWLTSKNTKIGRNRNKCNKIAEQLVGKDVGYIFQHMDQDYYDLDPLTNADGTIWNIRIEEFVYHLVLDDQDVVIDIKK